MIRFDVMANEPRLNSARRWLLVVMVTVGAAGCGGDDDAPRYNLSGTVTFDGQPVPGGRISFVPDSQQANKGPGAVAEIQSGRYATPAGKGVLGGPHVISIYGTDGSVATETHSNTLFDEYKLNLDLPRANATQNFQVPKDR